MKFKVGVTAVLRMTPLHPQWGKPTHSQSMHKKLWRTVEAEGFEEAEATAVASIQTEFSMARRYPYWRLLQTEATWSKLISEERSVP